MKKKHRKEPNHERWLLTYSDLITLLMIFFIMMYAMSNIDAAKYAELSQSLGAAMGGGKNIIKVDPGSSDTKSISNLAPTGFKVEQDKLANVKKQLDKYLQKNGLKDTVITDITERGLEVSLKDTFLFNSGKADVLPAAKSKLIAIGKIINVLGNYIRIEGHTDNVPIHNSQFSSNWQLSAIRAANVTELLIKESYISPQKISAVGYGEYKPKVKNDSDGHRALNRRVNIAIINRTFNSVEVNKP